MNLCLYIDTSINKWRAKEMKSERKRKREKEGIMNEC